MTRNEALAKLPNERWYGPEAQKGYLLDCLVSLGLIKFDEEPYKDSASLVIRDKLVNHVLQPMQTADSIVNALYKAGYEIVRK